MRGAPERSRQLCGAPSIAADPVGSGAFVRLAAAAASGIALGILGFLVLAPSLGSANDDAGIRSVQMQDARERSGRATASYGYAPVARAAVPRVQYNDRRYDVFQPIVRSFAPQPRPSRALPPAIQFGYAPSNNLGPLVEPPRSMTGLPPAIRSSATLRRKPAKELPTTVALQSSRSMCVRLCDGYHFPIGTMGSGADWASHEGLCQAACPAADVRLFTLAPGVMDMAKAHSRDGQSYASLSSAFAYRTARDETCTCQRQRPGNYLSLLRDITLRPGDTVIAGTTAKVFRGSAQWPYSQRDFADFRKTELIDKAQRRQLDSLTAVSLNVELLRPFTVARAPVNDDVAALRPQAPRSANIIEIDSAPQARPALRPSQGFVPVLLPGSAIKVVNAKAPGFVVR